jgi:hypothetical protein
MARIGLTTALTLRAAELAVLPRVNQEAIRKNADRP